MCKDKEKEKREMQRQEEQKELASKMDEIYLFFCSPLIWVITGAASVEKSVEWLCEAVYRKHAWLSERRTWLLAEAAWFLTVWQQHRSLTLTSLLKLSLALLISASSYSGHVCVPACCELAVSYNLYVWPHSLVLHQHNASRPSEVNSCITGLIKTTLCGPESVTLHTNTL